MRSIESGIATASLPGLARQSIQTEEHLAKIDGYAGQARV
jgi:hypothetical protein